MFDAMTTSAVSLKNVHLTLPSRAGNVDILRGVDLEVRPGEALGIVGPSGSGKTTLLMVIAAPLFYSIYIIMAARHAGERRDRTGHEAEDGAATSVIGAVMLSSTAVAYWVMNAVTSHPVLPDTIPPEAWPGIVGVAIVAGFVPVQAFYAGAQRVGAAQASLISTVEPLWTIMAAAILLGERLTPVQAIGGVLILGGVLLSQTRGRSATAAGVDTGEPVLPQPPVRLGED